MSFPNTTFIDGQTPIIAEWLNAVNSACYYGISGLNVLAFGVTGDGVTDDSNAFNAAALAASGKRLYVPAGTYRVKAVNIFANTTVECDRNAVFIPADLTDTTSANYCVGIIGDNVIWRGGKVLGQISTTVGVIPAPHYGMLVRKTTGDGFIANVTIEDFEVEGCDNGMWIVSSDECTVQNILVRSTYHWGISFVAPRTKRLIANNIRVYDTGVNEGIKIASLYQESGDATSDILLSNLDIQNCGNLDLLGSGGQNGMDLFISAATRLHINNFNIINSGASGIELKRNNATNISPNEYKEIVIENGIINSNKNNSGGISFNVTSPYPSTSAGTGKVIVSNVQFNYTGSSAPSAVSGITLSAWNDVFITGCQFNGEYTKYINPSVATAVTDKTIANLVVSNCVGYGGKNAMVIGNSLSNAKFINNVFETTDDILVFASSSTSSDILIKGNYYKTSGTSAVGIASATATLNNLLIENNTIISDSYAITTLSTATIRNNNLTSVSADAIRVYGGTCTYYNNSISILSTKRAYILSAGSISSYNNNRGSNTSAPTTAATVGEIVSNSTPSSGGYLGWICTTAGNSGAAVWKTYGLIS